VRSDNTYEVRIDGAEKESGSLFDDWDFLPAKRIKDPSSSKPSNWFDDPEMNDPEDKKPLDYDNIPREIPDLKAKKPNDWEDEVDGTWEPPLISNPEYKEWKPRRIRNPAYQGPWVHPEIPNPDYYSDDKIYRYSDIGSIGIDIWQVKSGTIFDNIIVTDRVAEAEAFMKDTFLKNQEKEKQAFEAWKQPEKSAPSSSRLHEDL